MLDRPSKFYRGFIRNARRIAGFLGMDILDPDFRITWITRTTLSITFLYFALSAYTIAKNWSKSWTVMLEASCMIATAVQGVTKYLNGMAYRQQFCNLHSILDNIYDTYEKKDKKYLESMMQCCEFIRKSLIVMGLLYFLTFFGIFILPFVMMLLRNHRYLMLHFLIPGLDVDTDIGFYITMTLHGITVVAAGFGIFASDAYGMVFMINSQIFVNILKVKIDDLNNLLSIESNRKSCRVLETLKDVINWQQLYQEYNNNLNDALTNQVSVQVCTSGLSIILTIYVVLTTEFPGGYPYIALATCSLYIYCIAGTKIQICNDEICYEIYNIHWYNMVVSQQKTVRLMLMQSQTPKVIAVARFLPLTVNTALQISKSIYSICMLMNEFLIKAK